ncbi:MAG: chromate transporter [Firmicutes bacterium]|nr:chromate transporter [Bacillota bacterium]
MIYLKLFLTFAKIGLFGFGGGMAMLPMIYQDAQRFGLMSGEEFSNLVAISQMTPGPIAVNAATYVGYHCAGVLGATVATLGVATPSFVLVLIVCYFVSRFQESGMVKGAFAGIRPVTVGLIAVAVIFVGETVLVPVRILPILITAAAVILTAKWKVSPIFIVIGAGIVGALTLG